MPIGIEGSLAHKHITGERQDPGERDRALIARFDAPGLEVGVAVERLRRSELEIRTCPTIEATKRDRGPARIGPAVDGKDGGFGGGRHRGYGVLQPQAARVQNKILTFRGELRTL